MRLNDQFFVLVRLNLLLTCFLLLWFRCYKLVLVCHFSFLVVGVECCVFLSVMFRNASEYVVLWVLVLRGCRMCGFVGGLAVSIGFLAWSLLCILLVYLGAPYSFCSWVP